MKLESSFNSLIDYRIVFENGYYIFKYVTDVFTYARTYKRNLYIIRLTNQNDEIWVIDTLKCYVMRKLKQI